MSPSPSPPLASQTRAPLILIVETILISLTFLALCGRVYSRRRLCKRLQIDDWFILGAGVGMAVNVAMHLVMRRYGAGLHMQFVSASDMIKQTALGSMRRVLYLPTVALVRVSILLFMHRLSPSRLIRWGAITLIVLNAIITIIAVCLLVFGCTPVGVFLKPHTDRPPNFKCITNAYMLELAIPILSALLDFAAWLVPAVMIFSASFLDLRQKVLKVLLLGLGLLACIPSVLRIPKINGMTTDPAWDGVLLSLWMDVEIGVGIIAASAPALYPLFVTMIKASRVELGAKFRPWTESTTSEPNTAQTEPGRPSEDLTLRDIQVGGHSREEKNPIPSHSSVEELHTSRYLGDRDSSRAASTEGE